MDSQFATSLRLWAGRVSVASTIAFILAATAPVEAQRFQVDTYTVTEGLPSSAVLALTQDSVGRMWFATRAGVAVYDGVSWEGRGAIPHSGRLFPIVVWDRHPRLWAGSRGSQV